MTKRSAGLLLWRPCADGVEVLLGHLGGPFWAHKDAAAWSIPKGEHGADEEAFDAARREFAEELGIRAPDVAYASLGEIRQSGGKIVTAWAGEADLDVSDMQSNTFEMEWPRGSGRMQAFPELDRAAWFDLATARGKLIRGQAPLLDRLLALTGALDPDEHHMS